MYAPPDSWGAGRGREGWAVWLGATALAAWLAVTGTLLYAAHRQDVVAREAERRVLDYALERLRDGLVREVRDYAWWSEAWRALVRDPDREWIANQFGAYAHDDLGIDLVFVFDRELRTLVAEIDGEPVAEGVGDRLPSGIPELLALTGGDVEEGPEVADGYLRDAEGRPVLVAVSPILPDEGPAEVAAERYLLFGVRLDRWVAGTLAPGVDLPGLALVGDEPGDGPSLLLADPLGRPVARLVWQPSMPGGVMRSVVAPVMVLAGAIFLAFAIATAGAVRRALAAARLAHERFVDMATATSDWLFETDAEGRLTFVSEGFARFCPGRDPVREGLRLTELCRPVGDEARARLEGYIRRRMPFRDIGARIEAPDGERRVRLAGRPWHDEDGRFAGYHGAASDVTESFRARAEADYNARHEPFTGLANRTLLAEHLAEIAARARLSGGTAAVLYADLDGFKGVNDAFGHDAGDAVLLACARRLRTCVREHDLVARVGGDEFVLVADGLDYAGAERLAARVRARLSGPVEVAGRTLSVDASIGFAIFPEDGEDPDELVRLADRALLAAKRSGRGRVLHASAATDAGPRVGPAGAPDGRRESAAP